jgi:cytochrome c oxidase cbb3-type subunit 3
MNLRPIHSAIGIAALALLSALGGCKHSQGGSTTTRTASFPSDDLIGAVPLGQVAGEPARVVTALSIDNPYHDNPQAIQQGKQLYISMNCAGCHAYNGKGNMGPDLTDAEWRYGGLPIQIYETIRDGRPQGMPAWGAALPPDEIWKLVAYIQSLGGTVSVSDYEHARQGDQPGEQVAPEAQADAQFAPTTPIFPASIPGATQKPSSSPTPAKAGEPKP